MSDKVLLVGEPMGLFIADTPGPLDSVGSYTFAVAGAEFNVAVGLTRLGHEAAFLTKLGPDPFGARIVRSMEEIDIDTSMVIKTDERNTGFMLKSQVTKGDPEIYYFRAGSAASTLSPSDLAGINLDQCAMVHLTGILPALSDECRAATLDLMGKATDADVPISFDCNLRPQLWPDTETMVETTNALAALSDIFLPGINECEVLLGTRDEREAAAHYLKAGSKLVIVKLGAAGAYYASADGRAGYVPGFRVNEIVDTVGAGDGFAAGVISALLEKKGVEEAVSRGCAIGAIQLTSRGDNEGLPTRAELEAFMADPAHAPVKE
ncbi:sugar kinase [Atopobiaceae bacterium 24-176]